MLNEQLAEQLKSHLATLTHDVEFVASEKEFVCLHVAAARLVEA